jgi:hypothetical protein
MKFWIQVIWIIAIAFLLELFLPWWAVAVAGAIVGYLSGLGRWRNFRAGFMGIFLFWGIYSLLILLFTHSPLPDRMAGILNLPANGFLLVLVTGFFGGLAGGLGAMAGAEIRKFSAPAKSK